MGVSFHSIFFYHHPIFQLEVSEKEKDKKDAEAALESENLETEIDDSPRPFLVKCCGCFAVFAIVLIVSCTIGSFLYYHYGKDSVS